MTDTTTKELPATIDVGEVLARELVFMAGDRTADPHTDDRRYILQAFAEDYLTTLQRFPAHQIKRTTEHYIDDTSGQWYACYNVDCFDPPMAIVRARTFESAYEVFCDEFSDWLKVEESDAADYPEDSRNYNGSGVHIDTDNVQIHELQLLTVNL